ncbi:peptidoglycan-binding domain-containing protein [Actinoplanes sp. NPDC049596]|uniref:peptidoglycan-binding domain-containing protein n=1 Tax=unclassified Actinoplanes TaxID=2626549 RepID=UPI0034453899
MRMTWKNRIGMALAAAVVGVGGFASAARADTGVDAASSYRITLEMSECDVMYVGVQGTCITSLQTWLNWSIAAGLTVDGYYGDETLAAVEQFQRTYDLEPDGRFGSAEREALAGWFVRAGGGDGQAPCDISTGNNCDKGEAVPGFNGGDAQSVFCEFAGGLACDIILN